MNVAEKKEKLRSNISGLMKIGAVEWPYNAPSTVKNTPRRSEKDLNPHKDVWMFRTSTEVLLRRSAGKPVKLAIQAVTWEGELMSMALKRVERINISHCDALFL